MSVAYYIVPEREIEGFDHFVNGKALAHVDEGSLDQLCSELGVQSILAFMSQDPDELADFMEDEEIDVPENLAEIQWFEAAQGLHTTRALITHLEAQPQALTNADEVLDDLREYESVLQRLDQEKVRWYLALDY